MPDNFDKINQQKANYKINNKKTIKTAHFVCHNDKKRLHYDS